MEVLPVLYIFVIFIPVVLAVNATEITNTLALNLSQILRSTALRYCDSNKNIIVAVVNHGYLKWFYNWKAWLDKLNLENYLVLALDEATFQLLQSEGFHVHFDPEMQIDASRRNWGQEGYSKITHTKSKFVSQLLKLGFNVLLSDTDIVVLRDPFPYFLEGVDLQIQKDDAENTANSGWYYVKSNHRTILFFDIVIAYITTYANRSEQVSFNRALNDPNTTISLQFLPELQFPSGLQYFVFQQPQAENIAPVIVHNNWIHGYWSKMHRLREFNFWLLDDPLPEQKYIYFHNTIDANSEDKRVELHLVQKALIVAHILHRVLILPLLVFNGTLRTPEMVLKMEPLYLNFEYGTDFVQNSFLISSRKYLRSSVHDVGMYPYGENDFASGRYVIPFEGVSDRLLRDWFDEPGTAAHNAHLLQFYTPARLAFSHFENPGTEEEELLSSVNELCVLRAEFNSRFCIHMTDKSPRHRVRDRSSSRLSRHSRRE